MTNKDFYIKVEDVLNEGYPVKLIDNDGFKISVKFAGMDNTGENFYSCVGIEGCELANISLCMDSNKLEKFVINNGFELYE